MAANPETPPSHKETIKSVEIGENAIRFLTDFKEQKEAYIKELAGFQRSNIDTQRADMAEGEMIDTIIKNFLDPVFEKYKIKFRENVGDYAAIQEEFLKELKQQKSVVMGLIKSYTDEDGIIDPEALARALSGHVNFDRIKQFLNNDQFYSEILKAYLSGNDNDSNGTLTRDKALDDLSNNIMNGFGPETNNWNEMDTQATSTIITLMSPSDRYVFMQEVYGDLNDEAANYAISNYYFSNFLKEMNRHGAIGAAEMVVYAERITGDQDIIDDFKDKKEEFSANWNKYNNLTSSIKEIMRSNSYGSASEANKFFGNLLPFLMYVHSTVMITSNVASGIFSSQDRNIIDFGKNLPKRFLASTVQNGNTVAGVAEMVAASQIIDKAGDPEFEYDDKSAEGDLYAMMNGGGSVWEGFDSHFNNEHGFGVASFHEFLSQRCVQDPSASDPELAETRISNEKYEEFLRDKIAHAEGDEKAKYTSDLNNFKANKTRSFDDEKALKKVGKFVFELVLANQSSYQDKKEKVLLGEA